MKKSTIIETGRHQLIVLPRDGGWILQGGTGGHFLLSDAEMAALIDHVLDCE